MAQTTSELVADQAPQDSDKTNRRTRLHDFQVQLVERMQAARSGLDVRINQLGIMLGDTRCLLNLSDTGEIVAVGPVTEVPLTQAWFLGLTNVRGNLVGVIDFARFHGLPATPIDYSSRVVCLTPSLLPNAGLLVSRVMGLRNVAEMELQAEVAPGGAPPWFGRRYVDRESQVWTELKLSLVVQDPQFLHIGL